MGTYYPGWAVLGRAVTWVTGMQYLEIHRFLVEAELMFVISAEQEKMRTNIKYQCLFWKFVTADFQIWSAFQKKPFQKEI